MINTANLSELPVRKDCPQAHRFPWSAPHAGGGYGRREKHNWTFEPYSKYVSG